VPNDKFFEIFVRKGDHGAPFQIADEAIVKSYGEMCAIAKGLVDRGEVDEAVVLEKRVVQRFKKYILEG
jgi:hypothetical protein